MWVLFMQFPLFITFIDVRVVQRGLLSAASYVKNVESIVGHKSHGNYGGCAPVQMALLVGAIFYSLGGASNIFGT